MSRLLPAALLCVLWSVLWSACVTLPPQSARPAPDGAPAIDPAALARAVHARVNAARTAAGVAALAWRRPLADVAAAHSADMARRGYFAHAAPDGSDVNDRAAAADLTCRRTVGRQTFVGFGENLYMTAPYRTVTVTTGPAGERRTYDWKTRSELADEAVQGWLDSPPHRTNLLGPAYVTAGVGVSISHTGDVYMTQVFC